jgi:hypothetical protein
LLESARFPTLGTWIQLVASICKCNFVACARYVEDDDGSEPVIRALARGGTRMIAMRCVGRVATFHHVIVVRQNTSIDDRQYVPCKQSESKPIH